MAYTLNTGHALYANLVELIGVQSGALVSHKTARTFTKHTDASYTSGTYGEAFHSLEAGYTSKGATFSPAIAVNTSSNPNTTVFVVINSAGANTGYGHLISGVAGPSVGINETSVIASRGVADAVVGYTGDATTGTAHSIAFTRTGETANQVYLDKTSIGSGAGLGYNSGAAELSAIGGSSGFSSITADIVWIAVFNKILNSTEIADLHDSLGASNAFALVSSGDSTAPTITSPSVTSVGTTTGTGNVTTDEGNGTLYSVVSASATAPSAAQIQAGQDHTGAAAVWSGNQAVSSTGAKTFSITGLTSATAYYAHFQHKDAATNNSTVATSAQFTTGSADTTVPTLTGSITISSKTTTSYTATWPSGSDNVAVTGYEYRLNAGSWVDAGNVLTIGISARTPGSTDTFEVRAYDAAGNKSTPALSASPTLLIGTITIPAVRDWGTGNLKTSETGVQVDIHNIATGALVVRKSGQTTHDTTGVCVVKDASITSGTTYRVTTLFADGSLGVWDYAATNT
jgi:hypothetical protein